MRAILDRRGLVGVLLVASLAFNEGVGVMFGMRSIEHGGGSAGVVSCGPESEHADPLAALGLSPAQRGDFAASRERLITEQSELRAALHDEFDALARMLCSVEPDAIEVDRRLAIISGLRDEMMCGLLDHFGRLRSQLREDQLEMFEALVNRVLVGAGMGGGPRAKRGANLH
jgi:hypothetical protein